MTALPQRANSGFTYADYLRWDDDKRWELIDGVAYEAESAGPASAEGIPSASDMSPAPGMLHQRAILKLGRQLDEWLEDKPCQAFVSPADVRLPGGDVADAEISTIVQPDIFVVCDPKKIEARGIRRAPDFLIEVASPSSASRDQITKATLYERHGVREYWVLSPHDRLLTIRLLGSDGRFAPPRFIEAKGKVEVSVLPGLQLDLDPVFERPIPER